MLSATCRPASGHQCCRNSGLSRVPPKAATFPSDHRMAGQRIGKFADPPRRQAGHLVPVVGPVDPERRRRPHVQQDAGGNHDQGGEVDRVGEIDPGQDGDRDGLHRHGIALEDVERNRAEGEGEPVEIVVPEAQQVDRDRQAAIERGAEPDRQDEQAARQRRAMAPDGGAERPGTIRQDGHSREPKAQDVDIDAGTLRNHNAPVFQARYLGVAGPRRRSRSKGQTRRAQRIATSCRADDESSISSPAPRSTDAPIATSRRTSNR